MMFVIVLYELDSIFGIVDCVIMFECEMKGIIVEGVLKELVFMSCDLCVLEFLYWMVVDWMKF